MACLHLVSDVIKWHATLTKTTPIDVEYAYMARYVGKYHANQPILACAHFACAHLQSDVSK